MKKLFSVMLLTLGLAGFVTAQTGNTWISPQPVQDYLYQNEIMSNGEFFDLGDLYQEEDGMVQPTDEASTLGIRSIMLFGESLAAEADLNNVFFGFNETDNTWQAVTRTDAATKATVFPMAMLAQPSVQTSAGTLSFMEKTMSGFIISAAGGLYFTDEAITGSVLPEITLPDPLADLGDIPIDYAARGFIASVSVSDGHLQGSLPITKMADMPVGYMAVCQDNLSGLMYLLVQYNLLVNNHTLVYQIKIADDGRVEYRIGQQANTTGNDEYYTFRIDLKRNADAISFGGNSSYIVGRIDEDNEKSWWMINKSQSLQNRRISIYPQGGTINGTPDYTSIQAAVVLSEKSKEQLENASSLLVFVNPKTSVSPDFENKAYAVGDEIAIVNNTRETYRVVYNGKPANLDDISFTVHGLSPNETYYLYAYLCKAKDNSYTYSQEALVFSDKLKTNPMDTPGDITAGTPVGNTIPLTFDASPFRLLVMKSRVAYTNAPQGVLKAGDTYGEGTVVAILEKGTTAYNIEMTPGEMTYVQMYAMTDNMESPSYSSNFALLPLYRQADRLPLGYTFGEHDLISNQPDNAMPILPPGLSTDGTQPDAAFKITYPSHLDHDYYYLISWKTEDKAWPNVIFPAFSGVQTIQATFNVKFYAPGMTAPSAAQPTTTDSVRIEYRLNGGAWQTARLFAGDGFPEAVEGLYPMTASITCKVTDVVNLRYSYFSVTGSLHAIASYEFVDASDCDMPTGLKVLSEKLTDKAVVLTWTDNNNPAAGQYRVSYQKYVAPAPDDDEGGIPYAETDDETEVWETLTVNAPQATLRNLEPNATYSVKVQAICASDESFASTPITVTVPMGMPYVENMTFAGFDWDTWNYATTPSVTAYKGEPGIEWEEADYMEQPMGDVPESWNAMQCEASAIYYAEDPDALAVSTAQDQAILTTPNIYIRKYVTPLPKTLTFRVNTYGTVWDEDKYDHVATNGVDLIDEDLRLYVLATTDGTFSWNDTVASFDHNALKAAAVTTADENGYADRGMDLSVKMDPFEGVVRIAFYFHNPNTFDYYAPENEDASPLFLEILGISLNYDGEVPCFPVEDLKAADVDVTEATLTWEGDGEEYGITYYPATDKTKAKTIYLDGAVADLHTITLTGLTTTTNYVAEVVSYCTKGDRENGSVMASVVFRTLRELYTVTVNITPEEAGTVTGNGAYFDGLTVTLTATANEGYRFVAWKDGDTELSKETTYQFDMPAKNLVYTAEFEQVELFTVTVTITPEEAGTVTGDGEYAEGDEVTLKAVANADYKFVAWLSAADTLSKEATYTFEMPGTDMACTAVFASTLGTEDLIKAGFSVSANHGQLIIRNLNGLTVKDIEVFSLTGNRLHRFTPNSREDLTLPVNAEHALLFVRLNTEQGMAVYKVYVH